jgi:2,4-dienoyl-CoA reductase-like NADH-dependent reductase (Old Yellow Enzyme family)
MQKVAKNGTTNMANRCRMNKEYPEVPMEAAATMSIADIEDTIRQFAASAKAAKDLG